MTDEHNKRIQLALEGVTRDLIDRGTEVEQLEQQLAALRKHNEELLEKISLDDCACSYDEAGDVCSLHSPVVAALQADIRTADELGYKAGVAAAAQQLSALRTKMAEVEKLLVATNMRTRTVDAALAALRGDSDA